MTPSWLYPTTFTDLDQQALKILYFGSQLAQKPQHSAADSDWCGGGRSPLCHR
jgi:hypothetical protein